MVLLDDQSVIEKAGSGGVLKTGCADNVAKVGMCIVLAKSRRSNAG